MRKIFFLILILITFSFADNVTFIEYNYCASDYYNEHGKCTLELFDGEKVGLSKRCSKYTKVDDCNDSSKLSMTIHDYNLSMAVTANFIGFTLIFLMCFLAVLVMRK